MITTGKKTQPFIALLYGVPKIGKTHLACLADKPLIIDVENGSGHFDVARIDRILNFDLLTEAMREAVISKDFNTIIFDSVTRLERIFTADLLEKNPKWVNLETPGYGKGQLALAQMWKDFLEKLEMFRFRNKNVILIGHQRTKAVNDPILDPYDRIEIDVVKNAHSEITASVDAVLYYRWKTIVKKGENGKKNIAVSRNIRELYTQERAGFIGGNRFNLDVCIENPDHTLWEMMK